MIFGNPLTTVLVEDEGAALRRLHKMANQDGRLQVLHAVDSGKKALNLINACKPKLILLDIELKDQNAFDMANQFAEDYHPQIIFITAYSHYAVEAFNRQVTDYLIKPYTESRFTKAIDRAWKIAQQIDYRHVANWIEKQQKDNQKLRLQEGSKFHYFDANRIVFLKAEGYYSQLNFIEGSATLLRITLKEMQAILPSQFIRINRSIIVNKEHIVAETNYISQQFFHLTGGLKFKISSAYYDHPNETGKNDK